MGLYSIWSPRPLERIEEQYCRADIGVFKKTEKSRKLEKKITEKTKP